MDQSSQGKNQRRERMRRGFKNVPMIGCLPESLSAAISHVDSTIRQESCEADCSLLPETHIWEASWYVLALRALLLH